MTPAQLAAIQATATRPRRTVPIVLDGDLRAAVEELIFELENLPKDADADRRLSSGPTREAELIKQIDDLSAQAAEKTLQVVIEGLSGTDLDAMRGAHPPREDNRADKIWRINTESSRNPLIQATAIGFRGPDDEVQPWADGQKDWLVGFVSDGQRERLYLAALSTSTGDDAVPLRQQPSTTETSEGE